MVKSRNVFDWQTVGACASLSGIFERVGQLKTNINLSTWHAYTSSLESFSMLPNDSYNTSRIFYVTSRCVTSHPVTRSTPAASFHVACLFRWRWSIPDWSWPPCCARSIDAFQIRCLRLAATCPAQRSAPSSSSYSYSQCLW